jgi:hypothetical protein
MTVFWMFCINAVLCADPGGSLRLRDFDVYIPLRFIGEFHMPKGGNVPIQIRHGTLKELDISLHSGFQPGGEYIRKFGIQNLDLTKTVEPGKAEINATIEYTSPRRVEINSSVEAVCNGVRLIVRATGIKREYGPYSSAESDVRLRKETFHAFYYDGRNPFVGSDDHIRFKGTFRSETNVKTYIGGGKWREKEPRVKEYIKTLSISPSGIQPPTLTPWFQGSYVSAFGVGTPEIKADLERVDRFFQTTANTVEAGNLKLARTQIDQLSAMLQDLRKDIENAERDLTVQVSHLPTETSLDDIRTLQLLKMELQHLHHDAFGHVTQLIRDIQEAKLNFSGNVVKGMFRSYLSWSGALPTDPVEGFAGYALPVRLFVLPRSLQGMLQAAEKDGNFLASQVNAIRTMESLQNFWERVRDDAIEEHRRLGQHLKDSHAEGVNELHQHAEQTLL